MILNAKQVVCLRSFPAGIRRQLRERQCVCPRERHAEAIYLSSNTEEEVEPQGRVLIGVYAFRCASCGLEFKLRDCMAVTGPPSPEAKPRLNDDQRARLIAAIKAAGFRTKRADDPVILDAFEEDVAPYQNEHQFHSASSHPGRRKTDPAQRKTEKVVMNCRLHAADMAGKVTMTESVPVKDKNGKVIGSVGEEVSPGVFSMEIAGEEFERLERSFTNTLSNSPEVTVDKILASANELRFNHGYPPSMTNMERLKVMVPSVFSGIPVKITDEKKVEEPIPADALEAMKDRCAFVIGEDGEPGKEVIQHKCGSILRYCSTKIITVGRQLGLGNNTHVLEHTLKCEVCGTPTLFVKDRDLTEEEWQKYRHTRRDDYTNRKTSPDDVAVPGEAQKFEATFELQAVGEDWDGTVKPLKEMDYLPKAGVVLMNLEDEPDVSAPTPVPPPPQE